MNFFFFNLNLNVADVDYYFHVVGEIARRVLLDFSRHLNDYLACRELIT